MSKRYPNKYAGTCEECGRRVPPQQGETWKDGKTWKVAHRDGECGGVEQGTTSEQRRAEQRPKSTMTPTPEQAAALALFQKGESMVIEAGAGTGKTATLRLLAESTQRRGQYIAFNRAIVVEAGEKFPENVACNTAHALAFRAVGKRFKSRLQARRMRGDELARILGLRPIEVTVDKAGKRKLADGFLAGQVMKAVQNFCQSADEEPTRRHVPYIEGIDLPDANGRRTFANNDEVARALVPYVVKAWADLNNPQGALPFKHDHYLKMWQLSHPRIGADFILFDEAQDANPVMAAIVADQRHAQVVYVGDSQQAIYEFTGAVNTLARLDSEHRTFLTQSFRFGPAVAEVANVVLGNLAAELRLVGTPSIPSTVGLIEREDAILCRTNAKAVSTVMQLQDVGRRPHLVGGGTETVAFAKAARELQDTGHTSHPELACFDSWQAVQEYVEHDAQGGELRLMTKLVDDFGVPAILDALDRMPAEKSADVIVSTAHKAKGREWDAVRLAGDFPVERDKLSPAEERLIYVAVTRARLQLDLSALAVYFGLDGDDDDPLAGEALDDLGDEGEDAGCRLHGSTTCKAPECVGALLAEVRDAELWAGVDDSNVSGPQGAVDGRDAIDPRLALGEPQNEGGEQ